MRPVVSRNASAFSASSLRSRSAGASATMPTACRCSRFSTSSLAATSCPAIKTATVSAARRYAMLGGPERMPRPRAQSRSPEGGMIVPYPLFVEEVRGYPISSGRSGRRRRSARPRCRAGRRPRQSAPLVGPAMTRPACYDQGVAGNARPWRAERLPGLMAIEAHLKNVRMMIGDGPIGSIARSALFPISARRSRATMAGSARGRRATGSAGRSRVDYQDDLAREGRRKTPTRVLGQR